MKTLWIIGGAIAGGRGLGLAGAVLGGGLGYCLAAVAEIRQGLRRLEIDRQRESLPPSAEGSRAERYPEETILDAMLQAEAEEASQGTEMEDIFGEVSGTKKKQLH